ncbi:MAG TPA: 3-deoxy-D-manno-octulosonic acid kinase [Steroidobacteraceae bacterium]|nr:3-deoxy-D-manno-octulosonic acid kinase [Steroidobacteraceae bacterium]
MRRRVVAGGAMLYDASRAGNLSAEWFDPRLLLGRGQADAVASGRGAAWFIAPAGARWVLRHYRRGGLAAALASDRYLWRGEGATRPFAEWQLTYHLHRAGLPVPAPVAASYRREGVTYRGDLITERLEGVQPLAQCLGTGALSLLNWIAIGRCLRRFHDAGACHADLNAHNVLLGDGDAVYLVDFDRGSLRPPGLWRDGNLVRLRRSLEKVCYGLPPERFTEADWHGLLDGYQLPAAAPAVRG